MTPPSRSRTPQIIIGVICLLAGVGLIWWSTVQPAPPVETTFNLLPEIDVSQTINHGAIARTNEGVVAEVIGGDETRLVLADSLPDVYRIEIEFRANAMTGSVGLLLPVGDRHTHFLLRNEHGGFDGVDVATLESANNPTRVSKPILHDDSQSHTIEISVAHDASAQTVAFAATVDGEPYASWEGNAKTLSIRSDRKIDSAVMALTLHGQQTQLLLSKVQLTRVE